ncbi:MAG: alpha/beta hydrolase [Sphingomonadaceae bacterium]|nr:alpha/beta hydrolase [Sphingomonadaceae bacterium]
MNSNNLEPHLFGTSRRLGRRLLFTASALVSAACVGTDTPQLAAPDIPQVDLQPCQLPSLDVTFRCGILRVEENRRSPNGRTLPLKMMVVPALSGPPAADPVFVLVGGPGQAATDQAGDIASFARLPDREIVLVDQRGTGEGHRLACDIGDPAELELMIRPLFTEGRDAYRECRRQLESVADLTQYATPHFIDDLEQARQALGYEEINLEGGSYGSIAAFAYMQRYPDHVRSVLMSGIATIDSRAPLHFAAAAQRAFDLMVAQCHAEPDCRAAYPAIAEDLDALRRELRRSPATLQATHPVSGEAVTIELREPSFTDAVRVMLYNAETARALPLLLRRARAGDLKPFADAALETGLRFRQGLILGLLLSATCSESVLRIRPEEIAEATAGKFIGDHRLRGQLDACGEWPASDIPPAFFDHQTRSIPTLLLSGNLDPVTPPSLGEELRRWLPNSLHLVGAGAHTASDECTEAIRRRIFAAGSVQGLDTSCIAEQRLPPFQLED